MITDFFWADVRSASILSGRRKVSPYINAFALGLDWYFFRKS